MNQRGGLNKTENVIDLAGGGALILIGVLVGVNGLLALAALLVAGGIAAIIYGIVKRQRATQPPQPPTTSTPNQAPEPPGTA